DVRANNCLADEGRQYCGVVAHVALALGHRIPGHYFGYTLQYVIFVLAPFSGWVGWSAHGDGSGTAP
ncbi:MAG: hypothetical protein WCF24_03555, partial [Acidimicrobiales bacterium]